MSILDEFRARQVTIEEKIMAVAEQIIGRLDNIEEGVTREIVSDTWFSRPFSGDAAGAGNLIINIEKPIGVAWVIQHLAAVLPANNSVEFYANDQTIGANFLYELTGGLATDHPSESGLQIYVPSGVDTLVAITPVAAAATAFVTVQGIEMLDGR